ncbi:DUF1501 domain-containing protein [Tautonia marina]|uniref:DUF1501 domain-containing protein n=1 Tax=Tautonia marina TaxID=2653855 RepID=UPI001260D1EF|nr:DUF1501 domain-containing protein [Tautonia marina]
MLTIFGRKSGGYCDGVSRRGFLKIGGLAFGSSLITLPDILRAEEAARLAGKPAKRHKAVINIFLAGGPPHQDMWDLKPEAPEEIRGEFKPIETNVPGIFVGETFPKLAGLMDRAALIRSVVGATGRHDLYQCNAGYKFDDQQAIGGWPSIGSFVSKMHGPVDPAVPPFVGLAETTRHVPWSDAGEAGFLGPAYAPFKPDGSALQNMTLNGITSERLADRRSLLNSFDQLRRHVDATGALEGVDSATSLAFDVLSSSKLVDALDLSKEDPRVRDRYGDGKPYQYQYDGAPTCNDQLLMARRLVEAGVRCVTLSYGRWDSHGANFDLVRDHGSKLDQCLSALVEDLEVRGMLDDTVVIAWGEFGRTPKINPQAGRDHWPQVGAAWIAGGGLKTGQVIGATNRLGEQAVERPVHFKEVLATLYHCLGIDVERDTVIDPAGRPQYPVDMPAIRELV